MSVKELTNLTLTDLFKEYKRLWNYWQEHNDAVKEFRRRHIERALEVERTLLICCKPYERTPKRKDHRAGYWKMWITLKDGSIQRHLLRNLCLVVEFHIKEL